MEKPQIGEPLPRADEAVIDERKLRGYALDPDHSTGKHKARVFRSALGINQDDWAYLHEQVQEGIATHAVSAVDSATYGDRCTVEMQVEGLNGEKRPVVTGWAVSEDGPPRLLSLRVKT